MSDKPDPCGPCVLCGRKESFIWHCDGICLGCGDDLQKDKEPLLRKFARALSLLRDARAQLAGRDAWIALAVEALRKSASKGSGGLIQSAYCPCCEWAAEYGHTFTCELRRALASAPTASCPPAPEDP